MGEVPTPSIRDRRQLSARPPWDFCGGGRSVGLSDQACRSKLDVVRDRLEARTASLAWV